MQEIFVFICLFGSAVCLFGGVRIALLGTGKGIVPLSHEPYRPEALFISFLLFLLLAGCFYFAS